MDTSGDEGGYSGRRNSERRSCFCLKFCSHSFSLQAERGGGAPEGRGLKPNAGEGTAVGT